ncbi:APH domain-containing protein [Durusdinium trenchii]|uniref:APH domain-containing protein n=1 Tax=Durusdinium trenchii TaxID=1381693 RepID=A0ABP0QUX2_9DINO
MDKREAKLLFERCFPRFVEAGLQAVSEITDVKVKEIASLWAGMGGVVPPGSDIWKSSSVYRITATGAKIKPQSIVAKRVQLPKHCDSIGDQRKKDSYDVEAAFYQKGHAERLIDAGCLVPFPLHVEHSRGEGVTICMTELEGRSSHPQGYEAFVRWLARLHATYWGPRADAACSSTGGLQPQGCYWHLDTRPDEHRRMSGSGWMGRLKLAARAIDLRLKAAAWFKQGGQIVAGPTSVSILAAKSQSWRLLQVCHGDAKGANILYTNGDGGPPPRTFHRSQELSERLRSLGDPVPDLEQFRTSLELALCDWRRFSEIGLGGWGDSSATKRVMKAWRCFVLRDGGDSEEEDEFPVLERLDHGKALASEEAYIAAMQKEFPA